jgi:hypothetical protein
MHMTKITIEVHNEEDKKLIQSIVSRMGLSSTEETENEKNKQTPNGQQVADLMTALAESTPLSKIKDPVAWQREVRQDRKLPFRD